MAKFNATTAGQAILAILLGLFGNQVSAYLDLPRFWVICAFILLVFVTVFVQAVAPSREGGKVPSIEGTENIETAGAPSRVAAIDHAKALGFPVSLVLGSLTAVLAIRLDQRPQQIALLEIVDAHPYEVSAAIVGVLFCVAYRWLFGTQGLVLFGLGFGLSIGAAIVTVAPQENIVLLTLYSHAVVLFSIALTLAVSRARWLYALAIPAMIASFYVIPLALFWIWSHTLGAGSASQQLGNLDFFAPGRHRYYYEVPFEAPPGLSVTFNGGYPSDARLRVVDQSALGFELEIESSDFPVSVWFEARGTPANK